ncbi:MAG: Uma2 family endonuclease [Myxococcales bacterium]|nr:Uma2 family endonuclease [Myxococcales bacterium]
MVTAARTPTPLRARLDALPEGQKGEIIDGELFVQPRPRFRHARTTGFVAHHIGGAFDFDEGGPGGWWIVPEPGIELPGAPEVSPDVAGWRRERMPEPPPEGEPLRLAPDWVCEVLSPSNRRWDLNKKFPFHARVGVAWLWVVDPPVETICVRTLVAGSWKVVREVVGGEPCALEPFEAIELPLGRLWLSAVER